jgi:type IV pilus assembly protein PilE
MSTIRKARREDAIVALLELQMSQEKWRANNPTYTSTLSDLGLTSTSRDGYYTLAVTSLPSATAFTATATPKTGTSQASDSCTFTLTQEGPDTSDATKKTCWNK